MKSPDPCRINKWQWHKYPDIKPPMDVPLVVLVEDAGGLIEVLCKKAWQSSLPNQPIKFYVFDPFSPDMPRMELGSEVLYWMELPELPKEQYGKSI